MGRILIFEEEKTCFRKNLDFQKNFGFYPQSAMLEFVTRDLRHLTLETLITFLTIVNNNINNYIVTFEYRVMVTAFAILAMFFAQISAQNLSKIVNV